MAGTKTADAKHDTASDEARERTRGEMRMDKDVVATIAGLAARDIKGIHSLRKSRRIPFGGNPALTVGTARPALALDVVIIYGYNIREVAQRLRQAIAAKVKHMANRDAIAIDIHVIDIKAPDENPSILYERQG